MGEPVAVVDSDTAPRAGRRIVMWNPPLIEERTQRRRSPLSEGAELLADLVSEGMRTICFLRSRKGIELIQRFARMRLEERGQADLAARIAPYRAGYTPQQRREIEARLAAGDLLGVVATDALELGIDIGELDASICVTFPGTVASLRQMWGRAGRRTEGLAVYIAGDDALDQFFCRHPDEFLDRPVEAAILDHENERIQGPHVLAAAYEAPLGGSESQPGGEDDRILGSHWRERADELVGAGALRRSSDGRYLPRGPGFPAGEISLRSASLDSVAVVDVSSGEMLGTVEAERAFGTVHPGAVYLHMGQSYEVRELDVEMRRAIVEPFDGDWYTQPKKETNVFIEALGEGASAEGIHPGVDLYFGDVSVSEQVIAYQRKRLSDHEVIDLTALELPEQNFPTQALWYVAARRARRPGRPASGGAARSPPRRGAFPDRGPAAARDVRPLGHRGALDQRPLPDGPPHDLHLRRPPGRCGHRAPRLRWLRAAGRRRAAAGVGVSMRGRLSLVRAEPEVRQPERPAPQGGRDRADGGRARPVTVARTLPADVAPRFRGAARVLVRTGEASFEAVVAERLGLRLRGLAGLAQGDLVPLLFPRCRSLHTLGMRTEIDVVWLEAAPDGHASVLAVEARAERRRFLRAPKGVKLERATALELAPGAAVALGLVPGRRFQLVKP